MQKVCENCKASFSTRDSRQKTCGKVCADARRKVNYLPGSNSNSIAMPVKQAKLELPPPEELPAPYAKRVYDMWAALTGAGDSPTRIA